METQKLIEYLQDIVSLETQMRIAGNVYNRMCVMEKDNITYEKAIQRDINPKSLLKTMKWGELLGKGVVYYFLSAFILLIPSLAMGMYLQIACLFIVWSIFMFRAVISERKRAENEITANILAQKKYNAKIQNAKRILPLIREEKIQLKQIYTQCKNTLDMLYGLNIINQYYQDYVACGMFLQYFRTGRTHSLQQNAGDIGAYNLYENDLKYHVIQKQLERITQNQQLLLSEVSQINNNVERLCSTVENFGKSIKSIEQNTTISAWCNAATAINTSAMRRMQKDYYRYMR